MRTSLNELLAIEKHLLKNNIPEKQLLFEANLLINSELQQKVIAQQEAYQLIQLYGRRQLRAELDKIHHTLFTNSIHNSFALKIKKLFIRL